VLSIPSAVTVDATGPAGAVVTFEASATDVVDGVVPVTCIPTSGSTFPIGDTTVQCSASDAAGHTATGSFVVHVRGTAEQLDSLHALITSFGLDRNLDALLQNKVSEVETAIAEQSDVCTKLDQTLIAVFSRTGSGDGELPFADALQLLDATNTIEIVAGCIPQDSLLPAVQRNLVALMETIDGLDLSSGEESALLEKTEKAAQAAVRGSPCVDLSKLTAKIAADTGKPNKLTAAQGAALLAAVAAIASEAGCA